MADNKAPARRLKNMKATIEKLKYLEKGMNNALHWESVNGDLLRQFAMWHKQLKMVVHELEQESSAAGADTARLDWLDNWGYEFEVPKSWSVELPSDQTSNTRNVRAAIDAARKAPEEKTTVAEPSNDQALRQMIAIREALMANDRAKQPTRRTQNGVS